MRRMNYTLAAIIAAVLVLQTPMIARADGIFVNSWTEAEDPESVKVALFESTEEEATFTYEFETPIERTDKNYTYTNTDNNNLKELYEIENEEVVFNYPAVLINADNITLKISGNVSGEFGEGGGAAVYGNNSKLEIIGDVSTINGDGVTANEGGNANIDGNVKSENKAGVAAIDGGSIYVSGDVTSINDSGVYSNNKSYNEDGNIDYIGKSAKVRVDKNVYSTESTEGSGVYVSGSGSIVSIGENVVSNNEGVRADDGGKAEIGGNVESTIGSSVIAEEKGIVNVNGDVTSASNTAVSVLNNSTVVVNGNVTSGNTENDGYTGVITDNTSTLLIKGNVSLSGDNIDSGSVVWIDLKDVKKTESSVVILGNIESYDDKVCSIFVNTNNLKDKPTITQIIDLLPNIIVGNIGGDNYIACDDDYIDTSDYDGIKDDSNDDVWTYIIDALKQTINYYIKHDDGITLSSDENLVSVTVNDETYTGAKANGTVTFSVDTSKYTLLENSLENLEWTDNKNGTYTITVPKGGGIYIKTNRIISIEENEDSVSITISASDEDISSIITAYSYATIQQNIQNEIKSIPTNGIYEIVSDSIISFNRKTMEAFAARPDVDISVTYVYNGMKYKTIIPAGYPVTDLLDENGYCGCLYLNHIFGSELVE